MDDMAVSRDDIPHARGKVAGAVRSLLAFIRGTVGPAGAVVQAAQPDPAQSPAVAFSDLTTALMRMSALQAMAHSDPDDLAWVSKFDQQVDKALDAYARLTEHPDAIDDVQDCLAFIYDGGAP